MGLQHFYTHTLRPGFRFSLAMHICGLHSPSRCLIFKVFLFPILIFHKVFILSLSNQVLGSHSPFRCLVYTLQSLFFFFRKNHFHTLTFRPGFRFSLSVRIFDLHSFFSQSGFFMTFHIFYTITLQACVSSHSRCRSLVYTLQADFCFFFCICFSNLVCH